MVDVVVVGGAHTDFLVKGAYLPRPGETARGDVHAEAPGGKGANQAVAAARLGARVALVARVGRDLRGQTLLGRLEVEGIDVSHVHRDPHAPTGVSLIHIDASGNKQILNAPGANVRLRPADVWNASSLISQARVLILALEPPFDTVMAASELAESAGVPIVLDPKPISALPDEFLRRIRLLRADEGEALALTGILPVDQQTAHAAASRLRARGPYAVSVAGGHGNLLQWDGGELWLPKISVTSIDTTGAGDAYAAAMAVALSEGWSLEQAGPFASAAAALATTGLGAQAALPGRETVLALLSRETRRGYPHQGGKHGREEETSEAGPPLE